MNKYIVLAAALFWGVFLVLIGTFGGATGLTVAGNAAAASGVFLFLYGLYRIVMDDF